jgi:hypothetical protein
MLSKKQLEDAAECPQNGLCTKCEMDCVRTLYNGYFDGCISEAAQTALAYRELAEKRRLMLKQLEWIDGEWCPICDGRFEHKPDCELAALLNESEVEEG